MMRAVRRILATVVILALLAYGGVTGWFYIHQGQLLYPANRIAPVLADKDLPGFSQVTITAIDGTHVVGWWKPPPEGAGVVLYLHGQDGNIGSEYVVVRSREIAASGFGVLALDYRGYGASPGTPTEPGLIADARAAYDFIESQRAGTKVAVFGSSLGTGVAVALAAAAPINGLVLDSPFSSALRIAQERYPWLASRLLMKDPWDSQALIGQVKAPILELHCDADKTVPIAEGRRLVAAAPEPKTMIVLRGCGHIEIWDTTTKARILAILHMWLD